MNMYTQTRFKKSMLCVLHDGAHSLQGLGTPRCRVGSGETVPSTDFLLGCPYHRDGCSTARDQEDHDKEQSVAREHHDANVGLRMMKDCKKNVVSTMHTFDGVCSDKQKQPERTEVPFLSKNKPAVFESATRSRTTDHRSPPVDVTSSFISGYCNEGDKKSATAEQHGLSLGS